MRLVTWNMGCGPGSVYQRTHDSAWRYLLDSLKADIALVQEALRSAEDLLRPVGSLVWSAVGPRSSGTAVFIRHGIDFSPVETQVPGSYVAALSTCVRRIPTKIFSVHVGPEDRKNHVALRRWLVDQVLPAGTCIIGGDLNSSRSYDAWHRDYLTSLSTLGLFDCHWAKNGRETQSFWGPQAVVTTYQDDHFFTDLGLGNYVRGCRVIDTPEVRRLSDHGPLVLEIESSSG